MFHVCVVCMVSVKGKPLIRLTGARCQLWELIISPRINIAKIRKCLLFVCRECNQLLHTMLEFRRTMHIGAKNLLFLYKNLKIKKQVSPLEQEPEPCHELPAVTGAQSDEWLPVANGEVAQSENWIDSEPCHELPAVIGAQSDEWLPVANEEVVQSETWTDVETAPVASETNPVKLRPALPSRIVKHRAVHVSEHNVDYAVLIPINEDVNLQCKEDLVDSSELYETSEIEEATPIPKDAKEETIKTELSSVSDASNVKKIKLNRQLFEAIRVTLKSPSLTEFDIKYEPESESESGCKSAPDLAREWELELARESGLKSECKPERELECKSGLESECKSALESERKLVLEWAVELARESALELERKLERKSGLESERKSGLESECKLEIELVRESALESERKSVLEWAVELARESALELERKLERKSGLESERKSGLESERKSGLESGRKSALESERKLESESERKSGHESARDDSDSQSTLSCESDYDDPEHFPNIIFAKAFNGLADKGPQMQETDLEQREESSEHIHCHLVTNPPSEWPCTGEQCRLQGFEDEDSKTLSDTPPDTPIVRPKKNVDPGRPRCKLCGRSFTKISMLWQHFERSHMDAKLKCSVCRKEFRNETELTFHKMKHQFKKTVEFQFEAPSRHACLECAVRCRGARHLRAHLGTRTHAAKMLWRFQCDICKRKCADKKQMAEHIQREHLAKEAVKCSMCSASFSSARTLRRHVAKHIVDSQTQKNKQTDKQTNAQARKRARDTHTKGNENTDSNILRNGKETHTEIQTNGQTRKRPHDVTKTSTAGYRPPPKSATPLPGHQSTLTTTKRPRKATYNELYAYADRRRNTHADTIVNKQDDMELQTNGQTRKITNKKLNAYDNRQGNAPTDTCMNKQDDIDIQANGQTSKKSRKLTHKKVNAHANRQTNEHTDGYINEQDDMTEIQTNGQTRKKPRKVKHKKVNAYTNSQGNRLADTCIIEQDGTGIQTNKQTHKITNKKVNTYTNRQSTHADTNINKQAEIEIQANGQTRKKPRKTTSQANTFTNKQENIHTDTYVYGQENTHETQKNTRKIVPNTHTDIQESIPTDTTNTHTSVRKRRKRRSYLTSKRARMLAKAAAERAQAAAGRARGAGGKTSLFEMLSSFIL